MQRSFLENSSSEKLPEPEFEYIPNFLAENKANAYFHRLSESIPWEQSEITVYGKTHLIPRLQSWHGDPSLSYRYSGKVFHANPWTKELLQIRKLINEHCQRTFNAVLANFYRNGLDKMGWHADNEPELGPQPCIASLSLGAERSFHLRRNNESKSCAKIDLEHGSLLIMRGNSQAQWQHALPQRKRVNNSRINLTFRHILADSALQQQTPN